MSDERYPVYEALVTILVHHVATGFDLTSAEIERFENQLTTLVHPLRGSEREPLPAAVTDEIQFRRHQRALDDLHARGRASSATGTITTTRPEWTDQISHLIDRTYELPADRLLTLSSAVDAALSELGVHEDGRGRAAHHRADQLTTHPLWGSTAG